MRFLNRVVFFLVIATPGIISGQVVINEALVGPVAHPNDNSLQPGINANSLYNTDPAYLPPYNREYIELYNAHTCDTIDISCYILGSNASSTISGPNWGAFTFPAGTKIPPMGFLLIGGNYSPSPVIDFDITWYRQNGFNVQYLTGSVERWFLRDQWGWVALYDPQGNVVDAIYWNALGGNSGDLYIQQEYQNDIVNALGCSGPVTLPGASSIQGITYVGHINSSSMTSFQRIQDGSPQWHPAPVPITPRAPNGTPVGPPAITFTVTADYCDLGNGTITAHLSNGGSQPYTLYWNGSSQPGDSVLQNLPAGTYTLDVYDINNCFMITEVINVPSAAGPEIDILSLEDETCSNMNGSIIVDATGGLPPLTYTWNNNPSVSSPTLTGLAAGNYHLTVTDQNGCEAIQTITLDNHREPTAEAILLSPDSCGYGQGRALAMVTGDHPPYQYLWNTSPQQTDSIANQLAAGNYTVTVTDGVCTVTTHVTIPLIPAPEAYFDAIPQVVYIQNPVVQFIDRSPGNVVAWNWDFDDGATSALQNPEHLFGLLGTYQVTLTVADDVGCEGSFTKPVRVKDATTIFFPNAFAPNGDGHNDTFGPVGDEIENYTLTIYDRWGRTLFKATDPDTQWDGTHQGKPLPDGVYVWLASFSHDYGDYIVRDLVLKGTVTLVR